MFECIPSFQKILRLILLFQQDFSFKCTLKYKDVYILDAELTEFLAVYILGASVVR